MNENQEKNQALSDFPPGERFLSVIMDLNNQCNLKCIMCDFSDPAKSRPPVTMALALFKKIAGEVFPKTKRLQMSCGAEPLTIKEFPDYLRVIKPYAIPETCLLTNGVLLNGENIAAIIDSGLSRLEVSIDGAREETYERIRRGGRFAKLVGNLKTLRSMKQSAGSAAPALHFNYTAMQSNLREIPEFVRFAKEMGAESVRVSHLILFKGLDLAGESLTGCPEEANRIFDEARKISFKLGMRLELPPNFGPHESNGENPEPRKEGCLPKPRQTAAPNPAFNKPDCPVPDTGMVISPGGNVTPCVWFPTKEWHAGSFENQGFEGIWNGPVYTNLRNRFKDGLYTPHCRSCVVWGNESIENYDFAERVIIL